ncbi:serine/threonine-protein kinase pakB [Aspergillus udagawae]|uniref:Serine/threonine-protein kinase pakB n=1 Tax=Aspergillus udagawae TaxID=91492 RepID=A0ABQ1B8Z5_9EURO|nr:serine/threonine-protein kinase pakB [Aspergillus udagawae]
MMGSNKHLHESDSQLSGDPAHQSSQMLQVRSRCQTGATQSRETHIGSGKVIQGPPKSLGLLQVLDPGSSTSPPLIVRQKESPWDTFKPVFSCKLAGTVIIAVHKTRPSQLEAIRAYSPERADEVLRLFQITQHDNILSAKECYKDGDELFVLVDDLPLTLEHLASLHPDQHQVASVMFQVRHAHGK